MPTETNRTLLERHLVSCVSLVIYPPADPQWGHLRGIVCPKQSEDEETQVLLDENSAIMPELRAALGMDRSTTSYRFIPMGIFEKRYAKLPIFSWIHLQAARLECRQNTLETRLSESTSFPPL
ncbi:hypothetical protein M514_25757 [Trichuris suis]|uniref:Uncharacterized protein n=1 Tax=Trichuris suis TaxID=68888 RepID=A0A085MXU2_9BILA|nr:hypothetical protein M514_25757 [Trichuris suis]